MHTEFGFVSAGNPARIILFSYLLSNFGYHSLQFKGIC